MHSARTARFWVIMPAAGTGRRMGSTDRPKQYLPLAGRTVIEWAAAPFLRQAHCERLVIVLAADDPHWRECSLSSHERVMCAAGGNERADSVLAGLMALSSVAHEEDWVLVHDAARACLSNSELDLLLDSLANDPVGGLLATPVVDTLKRADQDGYVAQTMTREGLWRALTPQMFRFGLLQRALEAAREQGVAATDDAQAVEMLGLRPKLVPGSADNIKITTPEDMQRAALILAARGQR